jgi:hypothetical protein
VIMLMNVMKLILVIFADTIKARYMTKR